MPAIDLPDVNVWLALSAPDHVHRERAERYWREEAAARLAFNAVTMLGLVRICSNAPLFDGAPLEPAAAAAAWAVFQKWMNFEEIVYLTEPVACRASLNELVVRGVVARRLWTDAYLAAIAISRGLRLVTFDHDFERFEELDMLLLQPEEEA